MSGFLPDVQKYVAAADAKVVENIVRYCGIAEVIERMKNEPRKSRVTFYYLLAEVTGTLTRLA